MEPRLGYVLKRAEQALTAEKTRVLRDFDLTIPQFATLLVLVQAGEASAAQLARVCLVTPQTMATVLDNLERKGLIRRTVSPLHQRVRAARPTAAGTALFERADPAVTAVEDRLAAAFTPAERAALAEHLDRAITAVSPPPAARTGPGGPPRTGSAPGSGPRPG